MNVSCRGGNDPTSRDSGPGPGSARPAASTNKGAIEKPYTTPPQGSAVICLDEMGPESAKSFPGQQLVHAQPCSGTEDVARPAERAKQEVDYGRRGKSSIFGAFRPATGEALIHPFRSRSAANWADFLERVEAWIPAEIGWVYAIVDNLQAHRATDVLLFSSWHPRWEFVFQPKSAAYLNLIEPWWKILRSLALKGRRFESWEEDCLAVAEATAYGNKHRHPSVRGRRRRHRPRRRRSASARWPAASAGRIDRSRADPRAAQ